MNSAKVLPLKLREPRGLALLAICFLASSALELAIIHYGFRAPGLEDTYVVWRLGLWTFFLPALVVLVLTFSWLHLTRSFLVAPKPVSYTHLTLPTTERV